VTGSAHILRANSRSLPLADDSVDLVVTSPPYFALRSYQDGGEHYAGQIGDEPTPAAFVDSLLEVTRECMRVLKPSGSLWVNLGDKYSGAGRGNHDSDRLNNTAEFRAARLGTLNRRQHVGKGIIPPKSLMGIPWRYAIRCIDDLGLILRAEVIWSKPNGLPESVTDRVRRSHEQWFHFTLNPRYYSAVDEIREPTTDYKGIRPVPLADRGRIMVPGNTPRSTDGQSQTSMAANPLGKLPGSVWEIATEPLKVPDHLGIDHFAAFPTEWPRRIIQGWSPAGVCTACGEGRRPVVVRGPQPPEPNRGGNRLAPGEAGNGTLGFRASKLSGQEWNAFRAANPDTITGYSCACPEPTAPTTPSVILDPFGGTGTAALVAKALGRRGISVDMSADYCRLASWRTNDPDQIAKAMRVDKPAKQVEGQISMLDLLEDGGAA
jgi:DNA modification methylase